MVIKNQNYDSIGWMVNFKKIHQYINSDKFVEDLLYNQYDFNKENNFIYVDLERGVVVDRAIPGSTLKTVKITCGNISQLGMTNPQSIESIAGTRERFNKFSKEFLFNRSCPNWVNNAPDRIKRLATGSLPWSVFNKEEQKDIIKYISIKLVCDRCYLGKVKVDRTVDLNNFSITNSDESLTEIFREELSTYSLEDLDKMCDRFSNYKAKLVSLEDDITKGIVEESLYFGLDKVPDYSQLKEMYYNGHSFNVFYEEVLFPAYKIYSKNNMSYNRDLDLYIQNATTAIFEYYDLNPKVLKFFYHELKNNVSPSVVSELDISLTIKSKPGTTFLNNDTQQGLNGFGYIDKFISKKEKPYELIAQADQFEVAVMISDFKSFKLVVDDENLKPKSWGSTAIGLIKILEYIADDQGYILDNFKIGFNCPKFLEYLHHNLKDPHYFLKSWKQILINDFDVIITDRELQAATNLAKIIEDL
jgi:hypothetical protein